MQQDYAPQIGFFCAYTPLALIDAAGFNPHRILPYGDWPDQAGHLLHDNLCPHVKRILDRALEKDLPKLAGMIFVNSCDGMRRAFDAWRSLRPEDPIFMIDLPSTTDESAIQFLAGEFSHLATQLQQLGGNTIRREEIESSMATYHGVADLLLKLREKAQQQLLAGGRPRLQKLYNLASTHGLAATRDHLQTVLNEPSVKRSHTEGVPIYLFGNVLADPDVYSLLESCGVDIVGDDFCTSERMFSALEIENSGDIYMELARSVLTQSPCARTFISNQPGKMAIDILAQAKACNARGVIGHALKFCDPYLARLPHVRDVFSREGLPLMLLEGDCSLRSIGQQRTRIEAFIEMLR